MSGVPAVRLKVPSSLSASAHGGVATDVEPEAGRDAAALVGAERGLPVIAFLGRLERLDQADRSELRTISSLRAFLGGVLEAELDRIQAQRLGQFVDHALDRELGNRRSRCAVGGDLRPVGDDVIADDLHVLEIIRRERGHRTGADR